MRTSLFGMQALALANTAVNPQQGADAVSAGQAKEGRNAADKAGDTNILGGVVKADQVTANIGGNLTIQSLQDKSQYKQQSQQVGGSVTFGPAAGGSVNVGQTKINSDFLSVGEQSAIRAGDGGFNVNVQGKTNLTGGQITSTQAAIDNNKNSYEAKEGTTTTDLNNSAKYSATGLSIGVGAGALPGKSLSAGLSGVGIGSDSGNVQSTTTAGISGVAGNTSARTGDKETGLTAIFDKDKVQKEVAAQVAITSEFGKQASKIGGTEADKQRDELKAQANAETDPDKKAALQAESAKWDEGGAYRVAMHTVIGGLTGGAAGAVGAGAGSAAAPTLNELQSQLETGLQKAGLGESASKVIAGLAGGTTAAAIGTAASGGSVAGGATAFNADMNNRQLHPTERKWLADNKGKIAQDVRAKNPQAFAGLSDEQVVGLVDKLSIVGLDEAATQSLVAQYGSAVGPAAATIRRELLNATAGQVFVDDAGRTLQMFTNNTVGRGGVSNNVEFYQNSQMYSQHLPTTAQGIREFSNQYGYAPPLTAQQIAALNPDAKAVLGRAVSMQGQRETGGPAKAVLNVAEAVGGARPAGVVNGTGSSAASKAVAAKAEVQAATKTSNALADEAKAADTELNGTNGNVAAKLPTATDATATSPYSSSGTSYGKTTLTDVNGKPIPTQATVPGGRVVDNGAKGGTAAAGELAVPAPKVSVNSQGITEITPSATPLNRQGVLNMPDVGGNGKLKPTEAAAAADIEPAMGNMQRYDGPPTVGNKAPDFQITDGPNAGKTVDLMYTTAGNSDKEISGMNKFFEKNMTVPEGPGLPPKGVGQIQEHFNKADVVVMDFRILTPTNQQILTNYINTLPPAQQGKVVIIK